MSWDKLSLPDLKGVARYYNKEVKIAGINKLKKAELIKELEKHLNYNHEKREVSHKNNKSNKYKVLDGKVEKKDEWKDLLDKLNELERNRKKK